MALLPAGCRTTQKEHGARGANPSVKIKAYWKDRAGKKHLVGGVRCQLKRLVAGGPDMDVAFETTRADAPLLLADLAPGRYRLILRGGKHAKETEEFDLRPGKRVTVRLDVFGTPTPTPSTAAAAIGKGLTYVLMGVGILALAATGLGLLFLALHAGDDDDDDC